MLVLLSKGSQPQVGNIFSGGLGTLEIWGEVGGLLQSNRYCKQMEFLGPHSITLDEARIRLKW